MDCTQYCLLNGLMDLAIVLVSPQICARRSRREFRTTEIEEALMAKAANIGLIKIPRNGNKIPAATGTPAVL